MKAGGRHAPQSRKGRLPPGLTVLRRQLFNHLRRSTRGSEDQRRGSHSTFSRAVGIIIAATGAVIQRAMSRFPVPRAENSWLPPSEMASRDTGRCKSKSAQRTRFCYRTSIAKARRYFRPIQTAVSVSNPISQASAFTRRYDVTHGLVMLARACRPPPPKHQDILIVMHAPPITIA
jgi:hypothetical protein